MKSFRSRLIIIIVSVLSVTLIAFTLSTGGTDRVPASSILPYDVSVASEDQWVEYARATVRGLGLAGDIAHEEWALTTFGSFLTLTEGVNSTSLSRDTPVFLYEAFGDVPVLNGFGSASGSGDTGGFFLIYNALTGDPMSQVAYTKDSDAARDHGLDLKRIPEDSRQSPPIPPAPTMARAQDVLPEATDEPR